eukprot:scaffold34595_cov160-Amphora_coffeaeformis.AAC.17
MQERPTPIVDSAASDCDSFAGDGPPACDDLLEVDQDEIRVEFTFPSTIYMIPSPYSATLSVSTDPLECTDDNMSTTSWTTSSTLAFPPRVGSQTSFVNSSLSQMDDTRLKLLHSMERTSESRRELKRRRLGADTTGSLLNCLDKTEGSFKQIYGKLQGELTF